MKNDDNKKSTYRIYLKSDRKWVEVNEDFYREYTRENDAIRKREQYHHRCMCPRNKWWLCDGACWDCEFHAAGDILSLDYTVTDDEGNEKPWIDDLADDGPDMQSVIEDRELLAALYARLHELDPEGQRIMRLVSAGLSERDAAATMGLPRNTFVYRRNQYLEQLRNGLVDYR